MLRSTDDEIDELWQCCITKLLYFTTLVMKRVKIAMLDVSSFLAQAILDLESFRRSEQGPGGQLRNVRFTQQRQVMAGDSQKEWSRGGWGGRGHIVNIL